MIFIPAYGTSIDVSKFETKNEFVGLGGPE